MSYPGPDEDCYFLEFNYNGNWGILPPNTDFWWWGDYSAHQGIVFEHAAAGRYSVSVFHSVEGTPPPPVITTVRVYLNDDLVYTASNGNGIDTWSVGTFILHSGESVGGYAVDGNSRLDVAGQCELAGFDRIGFGDLSVTHLEGPNGSAPVVLKVGDAAQFTAEGVWLGQVCGGEQYTQIIEGFSSSDTSVGDIDALGVFVAKSTGHTQVSCLGYEGDPIDVYAIKVDLDVDSDYDGDIDEMDDPLEESAGGFVRIGSGNLTPMNLSFAPASLGVSGTMTLSAVAGGEKINVWPANNTDGTPLVLPKTWAVGSDIIPPTVYIQGVETSPKLRDVALELRFAVAGVSCCDIVRVSVLNVDLDVDTDRDGTVEDNDQDDAGESMWTTDRGAIFNVNLDRDGYRLNASGKPTPDAICFDNDGNPVDEDRYIETGNGNADELDITPLVIRKIAAKIPTGFKVFLRVSEQEDIQRIHVYKKIKAGNDNEAIWGSMTGPAPATEIDITPWLDPQGPNFQGDALTGDTTFGIEGLCFRNQGANVPENSPLHFDGYIGLTLELRSGSTVVGSDAVKLKVAPWLMLPQAQSSEEIWAMSYMGVNDAFLHNADAGPGYKGLNDSGQLQLVAANEVHYEKWFQDHIEIGYTQRPGGPKTCVVFQLPYGPQTDMVGNPEWPLTKLLSKDVGVFTLGQWLDNAWDSADYGGNLEILPPNPNYKLGRIVLGDSDSASDRLKQFLFSQEYQLPVTDVPVDWLGVSHIDEITSFLPDGSVAVADPALAWNLLTGIDPADRGRSVFFATGAGPVSGTASANATADMRIETATDYRNQPWQYIRVYSGNKAGTVGFISEIAPDYIRVSHVWTTTSTIINGAAPDFDIFHWSDQPLPPKTSDWAPQAGSKYVLCQGSRLWRYGVPAIVTVEEVLNDPNFAALNTVLIPASINDAKNRLQGAVGALTFRSVPSLFFGIRDIAPEDVRQHSCVAFNPGPTNLQPLNGKLYVPRQFGPAGGGVDLFENSIRSALGTTVEFVDCWDLYHVSLGEVHCGSVAKRLAFEINWWENQP